jgi:hypothetical protein
MDRVAVPNDAEGLLMTGLFLFFICISHDDFTRQGELTNKGAQHRDEGNAIYVFSRDENHKEGEWCYDTSIANDTAGQLVRHPKSCDIGVAPEGMSSQLLIVAKLLGSSQLLGSGQLLRRWKVYKDARYHRI